VLTSCIFLFRMYQLAPSMFVFCVPLNKYFSASVQPLSAFKRFRPNVVIVVTFCYLRYWFCVFVVQEVRRRSLSAEFRVWCQDSPCEFCDGIGDTVAGFLRELRYVLASFIPVSYFIRRSSSVYNLSNLHCCTLH
jgi:hypothetical protein